MLVGSILLLTVMHLRVRKALLEVRTHGSHEIIERFLFHGSDILIVAFMAVEVLVHQVQGRLNFLLLLAHDLQNIIIEKNNPGIM